MLAASLPTRFPIPFANNAGAPYIRPIPVESQIGIDPGAASLTDGFVPLNGTPIAAGGVPPFEQDFNGLLKQVTEWVRWQNAGGTVPYDTAFSTAIGGYPNGAVLASTPPGKLWYSTVDNNTSNPDAGGTGWLPMDPTGVLSTGAMQLRPTAEDLPGWVLANGLTIGNAASNATSLASVLAAGLFAWHWSWFSNTQCPVFTSAGAPSTRGINAAADFAANKQIQVLDWKGTGFMGVDTMGGGATTRLSGVPVVSGNATTPGSVLGENLHSLILAENGPHAHGVTDPGHAHTIQLNMINQALQPGGFNVSAVNGASSTISTNVTGISIQNSGSGAAHNTVERVMLGRVYLKL